MMKIIDINLLPWRGNAIKKSKKRTMLIGFIAIISGFFLGILIHFLNSEKIKEQFNIKSSYILELKDKERALQILKAIQQENKKTHETLQWIQSQQVNMNQTVQVLMDLPALIPKGVILKKITFSDHKFMVEGVANSKKNIYKFMDALSKNKNINNINLDDIKIDAASGKEFFRVYFVLIPNVFLTTVVNPLEKGMRTVG